jgi:Mor family transcriptional regulator
MKSMAARRKELLDNVAARAAAAAQAFGLPEDRAMQLGASVADSLAVNWHGQTLYFPGDAAYQLTDRDRAILEAHRRGTLIPQLAREYALSEQWIRVLLKRAEDRDRDLRQTDMFGAPV